MNKFFKHKKIHIISIVIFIVAGLSVFQNCSPRAFKPIKDSMDSASSAIGVPVLTNATPEKLKAALFTVAKTFVGRLPTPAEVTQAATVEGYRTVVNNYLNEPVFYERMMTEHQNYFGFAAPEASGADNAAPARLGTYLLQSDLDYRDVLKTEICVDGTPTSGFTVRPFCDDMYPDIGTARTNAAGILTSRAFIVTHKPIKAFNFRIVITAYNKFNCRGYPDSSEAGMTVTEISNTLHPFSKGEDGKTSQCFSCHRAVNPKAALFYNYGFIDGVFTVTQERSTYTDTLLPSTVNDILVPGVTPRINGEAMSTVKDWGRILADSPNFQSCMATRYLNYMLGKPVGSPMLEGMDYLGDVFEASGYKVKDLLRAIAVSAPYIHRSFEEGVQ